MIDLSKSPWRQVSLLTIAQHELDYTCRILLNGIPVSCDPLKSMEIKAADGKVVGYIKGIRTEGNKIIGDACITDPETLAKICTPPITVGFSTQ